MRHELHTSIDINADPATVWSVLTDLDRYREWNPFIVESSGEVRRGATIVNRMQPPGRRARTFTPTVTVVEPRRVFEWSGRFLLPGIFDGRHRFELEPISERGTRVIHTEAFQGLLVRPLRSSLDTDTKAGFHAMNSALKKQAETSAAAPQ